MPAKALYLLRSNSQISGSLTGKRVNIVLLNPAGTGCEMQIQTAYSGFVNNDQKDFKTRVDASLDKLKTASPSPDST